ncbi:MAG: hypothetical protein CM1200mP29_12830 [Verrucomicrobiota bacterium]|nr:MAG: hypothetical protein CM1200mP29_12830 [Verrucomicrobiota bacterium]
MKRIQRDLKLTDKQAATVESAFKASREEMNLAFKELRPRMHAPTEKLKEKLRGDLTEEQLAKFEKYLDRQFPAAASRAAPVAAQVPALATEKTVKSTTPTRLTQRAPVDPPSP